MYYSTPFMLFNAMKIEMQTRTVIQISLFNMCTLACSQAQRGGVGGERKVEGGDGEGNSPFYIPCLTLSLQVFIISLSKHLRSCVHKRNGSYDNGVCLLFWCKQDNVNDTTQSQIKGHNEYRYKCHHSSAVCMLNIKRNTLCTGSTQ